MEHPKVKEAHVQVQADDALIAAALADLVNCACQHQTLGAGPVVLRLKTTLELIASERLSAVQEAVERVKKLGGLDVS